MTEARIQALLNGEYVDAESIDPHKHKFIGMFRPAECPRPSFPCYVFICPRGHQNKNMGDEFTCYLNGCFDLPQYVDISNA